MACAAASGPIGPGRLARTGPFTVVTALLVLVEVGVGLVAGALVTHPATRILTERGVRSTAQAAGAAAHSARERVEEGLGRVRDRRPEARVAQDAQQEGTDRGQVREGEPWLEDAEPPEAEAPRFRASRAQRSRLFAGWRERASERDHRKKED